MLTNDVVSFEQPGPEVYGQIAKGYKAHVDTIIYMYNGDYLTV